uniref:Beta-1,4-endoglucanase n=1 Tax=Hirschmanniella mucronata TaxID=405600 RepID=A0A4D5XL03_9BILA|nr:beta-1,4-endoglucanase [Hirschmanniella mucronata]
MQIACFAYLFLASAFFPPIFAANPPYGKLSVSNAQLVGSSGSAVQLRGMSFYWSQWDNPSFWTAAVVKSLACNWNANVVRAAMAVEAAYGGYLSGGSTATTELNKLYTIVDAAIANGIYVLIDWHETGKTSYQSQAVTFFSMVSAKYKDVPNVLYEIWNEPEVEYTDWVGVVRPYHQAVIKAIRANDANAIIICGTPKDSSGIDSTVIANPITGYKNIMYTLHWYPNGASWQATQRQSILTAKGKGLATFVTEYGVSASGTSSVDSGESNLWWSFMDTNKISYINWHVGSISETWSVFQTGTQPSQIASDTALSAAGKLVKAKLKSQSNGVSCSGRRRRAAFLWN